MTIFIDQERRVWNGEAARKKVSRQNDVGFINGQAGVTKVSHERWLQAQGFEFKTWMVDGRRTRQDNNNFHRDSFDRYRALQGMSFKNGIELGCGPFTNMRQVASVANVEDIFLLDPLIKEYIKHPHCKYKQGRLWVSERWLKYLIRPRYKKVTLLNSSIEEYRPAEKYDLILLINVIEHCQNVEKIWEKVLEMSAEGAVLVFADKYYDGKNLPAILSDRYDAGHPLKVDKSVIDSFLKAHWSPLYRQTKTRKARVGRASWDDHEVVYFIGKRQR